MQIKGVIFVNGIGLFTCLFFNFQVDFSFGSDWQLSDCDGSVWIQTDEELNQHFSGQFGHCRSTLLSHMHSCQGKRSLQVWILWWGKSVWYVRGGFIRDRIFWNTRYYKNCWTSLIFSQRNQWFYFWMYDSYKSGQAYINSLETQVLNKSNEMLR